MKIKLTDRACETKNGMAWKIGVTNHATGAGTELCSDGVLHYYDGLELALFMNPVHADFSDPRIFEVAGNEIVTDCTKCGAKSLTVLCEITDYKAPTTTQHVAFGILCALEVCKDPTFIQWANAWLDGSDRSEAAARTAGSARWSATEVADAAEAARWSAAEAATDAAMRSAAKIDLTAIAKKAMTY